VPRFAQRSGYNIGENLLAKPKPWRRLV